MPVERKPEAMWNQRHYKERETRKASRSSKTLVREVFHRKINRESDNGNAIDNGSDSSKEPLVVPHESSLTPLSRKVRYYVE